MRALRIALAVGLVALWIGPALGDWWRSRR